MAVASEAGKRSVGCRAGGALGPAVDALAVASVAFATLWEVTVTPHSSISVYLETIMSRERRVVPVGHKRFKHFAWDF